MSKPHVILVFGEPDSGKSWLADRLGYSVLGLDSLYVEFIRDEYPKLDMGNLRLVISQHYRTVLKAIDKNADKAWAEYVVNMMNDQMLDDDTPIVVEGYLLAPILKTVRRKLSKVARVSVVYVKDRRYYLDITIEQILART